MAKKKRSHHRRRRGLHGFGSSPAEHNDMLARAASAWDSETRKLSEALHGSKPDCKKALKHFANSMKLWGAAHAHKVASGAAGRTHSSEVSYDYARTRFEDIGTGFANYCVVKK